MKKNAFTLIELLAVIIILGIIVLIAIPITSNIVKSVKLESYEVSKKNLLKATDQYIFNKEELLPKEYGQTTIITVQELIDDYRLKEIGNPFGTGYCTGYVAITLKENSKNTIVPHLICNNDIKSKEDNKLFAHYTFDDYQEPTTNLKPEVSLHGMNNIKLIYKGIEDGYKKYGLSGTWQSGSYPYLAHFTPYAYPKDIAYSVSVKVKTNVPEKFKSFGLLNIVNDSKLSGEMKATIEGEYTKREDYIHSINLSNATYLMSMPKNNGINFNENEDFIYFKEYQLEQKKYSTPFTENFRKGIIKDYSENNNIIEIEEEKSPKWLNKQYYFDGIENRLIIPDPGINNNNFTVTMWIKPSKSGKDISTLLTPQSVGVDQMIRYDYENQRIGISVAEAADTNDSTTFSKINSVKVEEWSHIALQVSNNSFKLFINGNLSLEKKLNYKIASWSGNWMIAHRGTSNTLQSTRRYKGYIDEIMIYKRILNETEIIANYNSLKIED